jgi:hypothetical protein
MMLVTPCARQLEVSPAQHSGILGPRALRGARGFTRRGARWSYLVPGSLRPTPTCE